MLADLDETLRQLLVRNVPLDPTQIEISFDTPDRDWSGRLTRPSVNCFLHTVQENVKLRPSGRDVRRDTANTVGSRGLPPLRFDATYQITTWGQVREDEHRLLWRILSTLVRFAPLPADVLYGTLKDQPIPIPAVVGQPDQTTENVGEFWRAIDNRIRPVLSYVVTLSLDAELVITSPLVLRAPGVDVKNLDREAMAAATRLGGRVLDKADATKPIVGALVLLGEDGPRAVTDEAGRFRFSNAPRGPVALIVRMAGRADVVTLAHVPSDNNDLEV